MVLPQNVFIRLLTSGEQQHTNTHTSRHTIQICCFFLNFMTACLMSAVEQIGAISRCRLRCDARLRKLASISIMTLAGKDNGPLTPSLPAFYGLMFTPPWHQPLINTFVLVRPKLAMLSLLANVSNGSSLEHNQCDVTHDNTTETRRKEKEETDISAQVYVPAGVCVCVSIVCFHVSLWMYWCSSYLLYWYCRYATHRLIIAFVWNILACEWLFTRVYWSWVDF